jgi:hypothetical protein
LTVALTIVAIALFAYLIVRQLASVVRREPFRFRIGDLLLLTTAIALLTGAGYVVDAIIACLLVLYIVTFGRIWKQRGGSIAVVLGSFAGLFTIVSVVMVAFAPLVAWRFGAIYMGIFTSAYASFMFLIGDNATSELQLVLVGLPFGLPINIAIGLLVGFVVERSIDSW